MALKGFPAVHTVVYLGLRPNGATFFTRSKRHVIGRGAGTVRVEGDRGSARSARSVRAERGLLELKVRLDVEVFRDCSRALARGALLVEFCSSCYFLFR